MAYSDYDREVTADNPILRYAFNDDNSNSGSLPGVHTSSGVPRVAGGAFGTNGVEFDGGATDYVRVTDDFSTDYFKDRVWTIEAWAKTGNADGTDYKEIVRRSQGSSHVLLRVRGPAVTSPGQIEVYYGIPGVGTLNFYSTGKRVDDNVLHHIVVTCNGTLCYLYIDGVLFNSNTIPGSANSTGSFSQTTEPLVIGMEYTGTAKFRGIIDEVAIYSDYLTSSRIAAHFNPPVVAPPTPFRGWGIKV